MGNRNDGRECRSNESDEFESMDVRSRSDDETNACHCRNRDRFADVLAEAYNDGYKEGYCEGFKDGRRRGRVEGFQAGVKAGREKAREEVLEFISKNRCCCKRSC